MPTATDTGILKTMESVRVSRDGIDWTVKTEAKAAVRVGRVPDVNGKKEADGAVRVKIGKVDKK